MANKESLDMDKVLIDNIIYSIERHVSNNIPLIDFNSGSLDSKAFKNEQKINNKEFIPIKYKNNSKITNLIIQSPTLNNVNLIKNKKNYNELFIPLSGKKEKNIEKFIEFIENIEKKILYDAQINSSTWFPEEKSNKLSLIKSIGKNLPKQFITSYESNVKQGTNNKETSFPDYESNVKQGTNNIHLGEKYESKAKLFTNNKETSFPYYESNVKQGTNNIHLGEKYESKDSQISNGKIIEKSKGYLKLKIYNDIINKTILQLDGKNISIDQIPDESWMKMILEFNSIIISKNNFKLLIKPLLISFTSISKV